MLASLAQGTSKITNISPGLDVNSTIDALAACGIELETKKKLVIVNGKGGVFNDPEGDLECGNSGTTARLLIGLLAGRGVKARLTGDESLSRRPMNRIALPLQDMGARIHISARATLPLTIHPANLDSLDYEMPISSGQVKSALMFAGLASDGPVVINEPIKSRDHTENMLAALGVNINVNGLKIAIGAGRQTIPPFNMEIPGDPSSAAFLAAMVALKPGKKVTFHDMLINPTRLGYFKVLQRMGVEISWQTKKHALGEEVGTITVKGAGLQGVYLSGDEIPTLIDAIPVIAVLASQAAGETVVRDAGELRLKECDRIKAICENLRRMGTRIQELTDGFRILGPAKLRGAAIATYKDHRIAMAFAIAQKRASETTKLDHPECVDFSFPGYFDALTKLAK
jgi:3-phosphoshikimate 1-carboxyvinyltransferase